MTPIGQRLLLRLPAAAALFLIFLDGSAVAQPSAVKPYRALLVVDQWSDPASLVVDQKDPFQPVAALLKAWSVPLDILRLDQQPLGASYLFERDATPRYGLVVWAADLASYSGRNLAVLAEALEAGAGLLALNARPADPVLEKALGLEFRERYSSDEPFRIERPHFITRELEGAGALELAASLDDDLSYWVEPRGAEVLLLRGPHAALTVKPLPGGGSAVWLGIPSLRLLRNPGHWRTCFFRSLVWCFGYLITPDIDYSRRFLLEMDDWGAADKGFLQYWRYPTLSEDTIARRLIEPLRRRGEVLTANVNTGYVDRKSKRVLSPWKQKFTDLYGVEQDYTSTHRGMQAALKAGVMEIQSHGWTHMQPDLDSPPGPWWTADLAGEGTNIGWYVEFEDQRREAEVPSIAQLFRLRRSIEYLREDFGVRPLSLRPGGGKWSKSLVNHTARLAAQAEFGLFQSADGYHFCLDRDLVLELAGVLVRASHSHETRLRPQDWPPHPDGPVNLVVHDRDIAMQPDFLERLFAALPPDVKTMSMNQYVALLHARIASRPAPGLWLTFDYEPGYCGWFQNRPSTWRLWLADPLAERLKGAGELAVTVDGKARASWKPEELSRQPLTIELPAGTGIHEWRLVEVR